MIFDDPRSLGRYIADTLAEETVDADTDLPKFGVYTPPEHRRALQPDTTVVRGDRGVGKTVWFRSLQDPELRTAVADEYRISSLKDPIVRVGFGNILRPDKYPSAADLQQMIERVDAEAIWTAVTLAALESPIFPGTRAAWVERAEFVAANPSVVASEYARIDNTAASNSQTMLLLFDALDRMSSSRPITDRLVRGLLQVALNLRVGTTRIRAKVFARPDLLDSSQFTDASKLLANRVDLMWSTTSLFGLLFTALGNGEGLEASAFRGATGRWRQTADERWRSDELSSDARSQADLFTAIAGPYMGTNVKRGRTYQWLPNHLADGRGMVSPRSFLTALRQAAERSVNLRGGHEYAIHHDELKEGVRFASEVRVAEIEEDMPWVPVLVRPLEGLQVPLTADDVFSRWQEEDIFSTLEHIQDKPKDSGQDIRVGPRDARDPEALLSQLADVGVVTYRFDGRIDLPDVYRLAFKLGRKGGIPRVAAP